MCGCVWCRAVGTRGGTSAVGGSSVCWGGSLMDADSVSGVAHACVLCLLAVTAGGWCAEWAVMVCSGCNMISSALPSVLREWLLLGCCSSLWCLWGSEEGLSRLHVSEELWASHVQLDIRWAGMAVHACARSRRGGAGCAWLFRCWLQRCSLAQILGSHMWQRVACCRRAGHGRYGQVAHGRACNLNRESF